MTGYLVLARCGIDDVPLSLHATLAEARAAALDTSVVDVMAVASQAYSLDTSDVLFLSVVRLQGRNLPELIDTIEDVPVGNEVLP